MNSQSPSGSSGPTVRLAEFASTFPFSNIPSDLLQLFHTYLLDNAATMLAGAVQPVHADAVKAMGIAAGTGPVEAVGGAKVSLSTAALLDGIAAADFEFEHAIVNSHAASSAFPAILTLAAERHCTGEELLTAMVLAYEIATRIGNASTEAVEKQRGFHNPGLNGTLASAAGCCRLLKLDAATTASAMGIAASSSAGLLAFVSTGAMTKRLHPGRAAQLGLEAALMAQAGIQGPTDVLENKDGFLHVFSPQPDPTQLTTDLGRAWQSSKMFLKLSPVHLYAQFIVYGINAYRDAGHDLKPGDIDKVVVKTGPAVMNPSHMDTAPTTLVSAQYSVPFSVALALARDLRNPLEINDSALTDPDVLAVAKKITFQKVTDDPKQLGATVTLTLAGRKVEIVANTYPGFPGAKGFEDAASHRFDQVLTALHKTQHSARIKNGVTNIINCNDVTTFRELILDAARPA